MITISYGIETAGGGDTALRCESVLRPDHRQEVILPAEPELNACGIAAESDTAC
jgi:hypothetical protein